MYIASYDFAAFLTSGEELARMDADVLIYHPNIVLICFGMNDHVIIDADGKARTSEAEFAANLTEMVTWVRKIGAKAVLVTPNAVMEEYYFTRHPKEWYAAFDDANAKLAQYCEIIRSLAVKLDVSLADIFAESKKYELSKLLRTPEHGDFADFPIAASTATAAPTM